jgi:predicted MFS family arabinose efflux permease
MLGIGVLVLVATITGSYGLAGAVSATLTCGGAAGSPVLGRLIDRLGQRRVLPAALALHGVALATAILVAVRHDPDPVLFAAAAVAGFALPPISSMVRSRWTFLLGAGSTEAQRAYAFESVVDELVFIVGPVLVTTLATTVASWAGLACAGTLAVVGGALFSLQRRTEPPVAPPHRDDAGGRASAFSFAGMRILALTCVCVGLVFGTIDVGLVAFAGAHGHRPLSGVLLALVACGSGSSGIWYGRRVWRAPLRRRLIIACCALATTMGTLPFAPNVAVMAPLAYVAGFAVSPTLIASFALAERSVPARMLTEGFTWITTALAVGAGAGVSIAGGLVDAFGASRTLIVCPCAALAAGACAALGRRHLTGRVAAAP